MLELKLVMRLIVLTVVFCKMIDNCLHLGSLPGGTDRLR